MTARSYTAALDQLLTPLGFVRDATLRTRDKDWVRRSAAFEDVVNLQISSYAGATANVGTKDLQSEAILEAAIPPNSPGLKYPAYHRIGALMDGLDHWWRADPNGPSELCRAVETYGLPLFESLRDLEAQARALGRGATKYRISTPTLYLAVTLYRLGELDEACQVLANPPKRTLPSWLAQGEALSRRLGCQRKA